MILHVDRCKLLTKKRLTCKAWWYLTESKGNFFLNLWPLKKNRTLWDSRTEGKVYIMETVCVDCAY